MKTFINLTAMLLVPLSGLSQSTYEYSDLEVHKSKSFLAVEAGYLHSLTTVKTTPSTLIGTSEFYNKPGIYTGLYYESKLSKTITIVGGVIYQNKGNVINILRNNEFIKVTNQYHYLGVTPLIKIISFHRFNVLIGPEINFLINSIETGRNLQRIESGVHARFKYSISKFVLSVSYFKGLSKYDQVGNNSQFFNLFNSNVRFGISYILSK